MRWAGSGAKIQFGRFHLQFLGLGAGLIAKLDQGHQHGQTQAAHQDVENSRHVAQAQRLRALVLEARGIRGRKESVREAAHLHMTDIQLQFII